MKACSVSMPSGQAIIVAPRAENDSFLSEVWYWPKKLLQPALPWALESLLAKTTCGTPKCMSPELIEGKGYDGKSDLWSLGVVIFELLTLRCPFSASSIGGLVAVIVAGKMDACGLERLERSDASAELKRLVSDDGGLLDPSPAKRATLDDVLMCCPLGDGRCCPYK